VTCAFATVILGRVRTREGRTMNTVSKAYVVRNAEAGGGPSEVTQVYPYTLKSLAPRCKTPASAASAASPKRWQS